MFSYDEENIFAQIIEGKIPADTVYEDDEFICFRDIAPQAPIHLLIIPKNHKVPSIAAIDNQDAHWLGQMMLTASAIAKEQGLNETGYRLVFNCGSGGGQTVFHLHLHIIGGTQLSGSMV